MDEGQIQILLALLSPHGPADLQIIDRLPGRWLPAPTALQLGEPVVHGDRSPAEAPPCCWCNWADRRSGSGPRDTYTGSCLLVLEGKAISRHCWLLPQLWRLRGEEGQPWVKVGTVGGVRWSHCSEGRWDPHSQRGNRGSEGSAVSPGPHGSRQSFHV